MMDISEENFTAFSTHYFKDLPSAYNFTVFLPNAYQETQCKQDDIGASVIEIAATALGVVIGLFNMLVITVIFREKRLHKGRFFCICNLALADFLAGMLLLWIFGMQKVVLPFRTPQSELIQKSLWVLTVWSSMLNQLLIAIDRYLCIRLKTEMANDKWGGTKRKRWLITGLVLTWTIPLITFVLPVALSWNCLNQCGCFAPLNSTTNVYYMFCFPLEECSMTNPPFTKASMLYMGLFLVMMPVVPCVLYYEVYKLMRSSTRRVRQAYSKSSLYTNSLDFQLEVFPTTQNNKKELQGTGASGQQKLDDVSPPTVDEEKSKSFTDFSAELNHVICHPNSRPTEQKKPKVKLPFFYNSKAKHPPSVSRQHSEQEVRKYRFNARKVSTASTSSRIKQREMALLRTLVIILFCYLISTFPLGVLFVVSYGELDKRHVVSAKILLIVSLLNSVINPLIYVKRFKELRKGFKKVFCWNC